MASDHPLDRTAHAALTGRQAHVALTQAGARRYHPAYGVFAALDDATDATLQGLAALIAQHGDVAFLQPDAPPAAPGVAVASQDLGVQMVAERLTEGPAPTFAITPLTDADAPEMLALATLTAPGPFFERTHQLGDFFGVRGPDGALVAMAGERMKPSGFTEVSGVCTHPDHRGHGYAAALSRHVATRVLARGETPFLHAYATNTAAIGLYETLGFTLRREVLMTRLTRA